MHRELLRIAMDEPYRTLLGHFRHEIGHYYFYSDWSPPVKRTTPRGSVSCSGIGCRLSGRPGPSLPGPVRPWAGKMSSMSSYASMHAAED